MKLEDVIAAEEQAVEELRTAAQAIQDAPEDIDAEALAALEQTLDTAEAELQRVRANHKREERVAKARNESPVIKQGEQRIVVGEEPTFYPKSREDLDERIRSGAEFRSFFTDLYRVTKGDSGAQERLNRHQAEMRALNETAGTGGEFVPPLWMQDEWVKLARAARPFADAVRHMPLPPNTNSINLPLVSGGSATAAQADGGSVQSTDMATSSVSAPVKTIAGQQDVARQLLDRSLPGIDLVIFDDLARDYATKLDVQVVNGSGSGANATGVINTSSVNTSTYTDGSPTAPKLYSKIGDAIQKVHSNRFLPPTLIAMTPARWNWISVALDSQNRPLVTPYPGINLLANFEKVASEAIVGSILGIPVLLDASIPTNLGGGSNQDDIIVCRADDLFLFESDGAGVNYRTYEEVLSGNLQIRFQVWGYFAFLANRYPKAITIISGTGLVTPAF